MPVSGPAPHPDGYPWATRHWQCFGFDGSCWCARSREPLEIRAFVGVAIFDEGGNQLSKQGLTGSAALVSALPLRHLCSVVGAIGSQRLGRRFRALIDGFCPESWSSDMNEARASLPIPARMKQVCLSGPLVISTPPAPGSQQIGSRKLNFDRGTAKQAHGLLHQSWGPEPIKLGNPAPGAWAGTCDG